MAINSQDLTINELRSSIEFFKLQASKAGNTKAKEYYENQIELLQERLNTELSKAGIILETPLKTCPYFKPKEEE